MASSLLLPKHRNAGDRAALSASQNLKSKIQNPKSKIMQGIILAAGVRMRPVLDALEDTLHKWTI